MLFAQLEDCYTGHTFVAHTSQHAFNHGNREANDHTSCHSNDCPAPFVITISIGYANIRI